MIFGVIEPDLQSHYRKCINAVQSLIDYDLEQINHYICQIFYLVKMA